MDGQNHDKNVHLIHFKLRCLIMDIVVFILILIAFCLNAFRIVKGDRLVCLQLMGAASLILAYYTFDTMLWAFLILNVAWIFLMLFTKMDQ